MSLTTPLSINELEKGGLWAGSPYHHHPHQYQQQHQGHIPVDWTVNSVIKDDSSCLSLKNHIIRHGKIKVIDISDSCLSVKGWEYLLESFSGNFIHELESLNVSRTNLSPESCILLLQELRCNAPKLERLYLGGNNLGDEVEEELLAWIPDRLKSLDLSHNVFQSRCIRRVVERITQGSKCLETLSLAGVRVDFSTATAIGKLIAQCSCLEELNLHHCRLDDASADPIAAALRASSSLRVLDLSLNHCAGALSYQGGEEKLLLPPQLSILRLDGNYIHSSQLKGLMECIAEAKHSLTELRLSRSLDGDAAFYQLFSLLQKMPMLRVLDISGCRLTYTSGKNISQALRFLPALQELNVSDNLLDTEGATDVAVVLEQMKHLVKLSIAGCNIGNCGAVSLVTGLLRSTSPLKELDLSRNGITDVGIREISLSLSRLTSPKLDWLNLSGNPFTLVAQSPLEEMLRSRQTQCVVEAKCTALDMDSPKTTETNTPKDGSVSSSEI